MQTFCTHMANMKLRSMGTLSWNQFDVLFQPAGHTHAVYSCFCWRCIHVFEGENKRSSWYSREL